VQLQSSYKGTPYFQIVDRTKSPPDVLYPTGTETYDYLEELGISRHQIMTFRNATSGNAILQLKDLQSQNQTYGVFSVVFKDMGDKTLTPPIYLGADEMVDLIIDYTPSTTQIVKEETKIFKLLTNDNDISHTDHPGNDTLNLNMHVLASPSKLYVDKPSMDFGEVQVGKSLSSVIRVSNVGDSELLIDNTKSGLGKVDGILLDSTPRPACISFADTVSGHHRHLHAPAIHDHRQLARFLHRRSVIARVQGPDYGKGIPSNGAPCSKDEDCVSPDTCHQNRCCSTDCDGICGRCDLPDHLGTCTPLPDTTVCADPFCDGKYLQPTRDCDGKGACAPKAEVELLTVQLQPGNKQCRTSCVANGDCSPTSTCCTGSCFDHSLYDNQRSGAVELGVGLRDDEVLGVSGRRRVPRLADGQRTERQMVQGRVQQQLHLLRPERGVLGELQRPAPDSAYRPCG